MKKKVLLIGGTGGLGKQLGKHLMDLYDCKIVGSIECDVTSESKVSSFLEKTDFDIIIYLSAKNIDGLIHKQSVDTIDFQLDVNIKGFLNVLRYATPKFKENKYGRLIYISSILSTNPVRGAGIYSASKAFCDNIVKTYSLENSKYGITANSIQLGYFQGGLSEKIPTEIMENVVDNIPLKRLGKTNEFGNLISMIIETEYMNGAWIQLNGGL